VSDPSAVTALLERGVGLHQAGRLNDAEQLYDKVLGLDRNNPDALNLKGLIAAQAGRHARALQLYDRSIAAYTAFADAHYNKGVTLTALGREEEALACYAATLRHNPGHANARLNAGTLLHAMGRTGEAISSFRAMTQALPTDSRGFYNLGSCLLRTAAAAPEDVRAAELTEAAAVLTRAQALDPSNPEVRATLAEAHAARAEYALAIENLEAALASNPSWPLAQRAEAMSTLGEHLRKDKQCAAAVETQRRAAALQPDHPIIQYNLAAALNDAKQLDEAEAVYKRVIAARPDFVKAWINLGNIYRDKNRHDEAISLFEKAIAIEPLPQAYANIAATMSDLGWSATSLMLHNQAIALGPLNATARHNHAMTLLNIGQLKTGWEEYEARFATTQTRAQQRGRPMWQGEDLTGRRILVWTEEGAGDQILQASMIADLIARAGHVVIECLRRLAPIFARSFPQATIIPRSQPSEHAADPEMYDCHVAAGSLGRHFRRDFASFPKHSGYLKADPSKVETFRRAYQAMAQGRRIVGIAWRSRNPIAGENKSAMLANLQPILEAPGLMFVNLQYGDCAADLAEVRTEFGIDVFQDLNVDQLTDMDAFFAQVAAMDSIVTTSNTAAHVAGSQNIPTWLLLPHGKGTMWYWFFRRSDSPWYPSVRIVRAHAIDRDRAWEIEPARRVATHLAAWAGTAERD